MTSALSLSEAQLDRARGALLASAVGDALGAGYEFGSAPYDGWPAMIGGGLGGFAPGEWTDDTAQAVGIAEVAAAGVDLRSTAGLDAVAGRFADWYAGHPPDVGVQTSSVLGAAGRTPTAAAMTAAATAEHHRSGRSAGNGSLMRTAPVALAFLGPGREDELVEAAHAVSALTHHDPLAGDGATLWCLGVREAVLTGHRPDLLGHCDRLRDPEHWRSVVREAEGSSPGTFTQNAWVVGALQAAWSAVVHTPVPADRPGRHLQAALAAAIGIGHDTDTVAAVAGAVLGATWGASAVPGVWLEPLHGWPGLRADDLDGLARRIVGVPGD